MIREEEDDVTQETRALVVLKIKEETEKLIQKIESAKVPVTDEWTDGLNAGLSWAQRILRKDKSASQWLTPTDAKAQAMRLAQ